MDILHHPLDQAPIGGPCVISLGNFDGVHLGHQEILEATVARARELGLPAVAVTFDPHPSVVVAPERKPHLLMSLRQRLAAFAAFGLDATWVIPFSRTFSELGPEAFLEALHRALKPTELHVGKAFHFGRDRSGTVASLEAWGRTCGCTVRTHGRHAPDGGVLSSSRIRKALDEGDVDLAAELLGQPFCLTGIVVDGDRRGRHLGFPTANLAWEQDQLPAYGVYVTEVRLPHEPTTRLGLTNVGEKPTFDGMKLTVETFLPDFEGDLYGSHLEVRFRHRLRGEMRFEGLEALVAQIGRDVEAGKAWWAAQ